MICASHACVCAQCRYIHDMRLACMRLRSVQIHTSWYMMPCFSNSRLINQPGLTRRSRDDHDHCVVYLDEFMSHDAAAGVYGWIAFQVTYAVPSKALLLLRKVSRSHEVTVTITIMVHGHCWFIQTAQKSKESFHMPWMHDGAYWIVQWTAQALLHMMKCMDGYIKRYGRFQAVLST